MGFEQFSTNVNFFKYTKTVKIRTFTDDKNIQTTYLGIASCHFGTTGVIVLSSKSDFDQDDSQPYIINECVEMTSCQKNTFYTGLCNHDSKCNIDLLQSCSVCNDQDKILTIPYKLKSWVIPLNAQNGEYFPFKVIDDVVSNERMNLVNSCEIKGLIESQTSSFPNNCAV